MQSLLSLIKGLPLSIWLALLKVASAICIGLKIRQNGVDAERAKTNEAILKKIETADEARKQVAIDANAGVVDERLRKFYR